MGQDSPMNPVAFYVFYLRLRLGRKPRVTYRDESLQVVFQSAVIQRGREQHELRARRGCIA